MRTDGVRGVDGSAGAVPSDAAARRWAAVTAQRERLLRISRARTLNEQDAEDCVHEAMLRCVEFADLDEARLEQFLTSVTVRLCADTHRARTQRDRLGRRLALPPTEPSPEDDVCDRAEAAWVASQVALLPTRQRDVLAERAAGSSYAEVARRFGMSGAAVESVLSRARRGVRAALASTLGAAVAALRRTRAETTAPLVAAAAAATLAAVAVRPPAVPEARPLQRRPVPTVSVGRAVPAAAVVAVPRTTPTAPSTVRPLVARPRRTSTSDAPRAQPLVSVGPVTLDASGSPEPSRPPWVWVQDCLRNGFEPGFPDHVRCRRS